MVAAMWIFIMMHIVAQWRSISTVLALPTAMESNDEASDLYFSEDIPPFEVRRDVHTDEPVVSNTLKFSEVFEGNFPGKINDHFQKLPIEQLKRVLQCSPHEGALGDESGALSLLQLVPPSKEIFEMVCAWAETDCAPWHVCQEEARPTLLSAVYPESNGLSLGGSGGAQLWRGDPLRSFVLLRVLGGILFVDWPWGQSRLRAPPASQLALHRLLLGLASDVPDHSIFLGGRRPGMRWNIPVPAFSHSPQLGYGDLAWPWPKSLLAAYHIAREVHKRQVGRSRNPTSTQPSDSSQDTNHSQHVGWRSFNHSDADYMYVTQQLAWHRRESKAAFFGSLHQSQPILMALASKHPDVLVTHLSSTPFDKQEETVATSLDPFQTDEPLTFDTPRPHRSWATWSTPTNGSERTMGYLLQESTMKQYAAYHRPTRYKYVVVLPESDSLSASEHLAYLLAHSGAVVLLQKSAFSYHFSARLRAWEHYVPLSYSGADILEKVAWLQAHDDLARRIAANARHFGQSYLRLEDYICYAITATETVAALESDTTVNESMDPIEVPHREYI